MFQRRMAARRKTTPIERLQQQYQKEIESLGQQREKAYSAYRAGVDPVMADYEARLQEFAKLSTEYTGQAEEYAKGLAAYQKELADYPAFVDRSVGYYTKRGGFFGTGKKVAYVSGTGQTLDSFLAGQGGALVSGGGGSGGTAVYRIPNPAEKPKFGMEQPVAPTAPTKPEIEEFDVEPYTQKSKQLQKRYEREIGERKAGRMAAVSRRRARPLLGG